MKWLYCLVFICCLTSTAQAGELDDAAEISVIVESLYNVAYDSDGVIRSASPCFFCLGKDNMAWDFLSADLQHALGTTKEHRSTFARRVGRDPLTNTNNPTLSDFRYTQKQIDAKHAQVTVQFSDAGTPQSIVLQLEKTANGWLVHDIGNLRGMIRAE